MANFNSLSEYEKQVKQWGQTSKIKAGYFFSYNYAFIKDKKNPQLKYYDTMPLAFVYYVKGDDFWGINLHHAPVEFREDILRYLFGDKWMDSQEGFFGKAKQVAATIKQKLKRLFTSKGTPKKTEFKKISKNYKQLMKVYSDASLMVRRYKVSRSTESYTINSTGMPLLMQYTAPTYYKSTYKAAMKNFYLKRSKQIEKSL